jgi:hypothetical protein
VTTAIVHFMRELERAWDAHLDALLVRSDVTAAMAPLAAEPSLGADRPGCGGTRVGTDTDQRQ